MPQITTTVLTDRETSPVSHSFVPSDIAQPGSVGVLLNSPTGILANAEKLTVSSRKTVGGKLKGRVTIAVPIVETVSGVPTVTRVGYATLDTSFDLLSTLQERKNVIGLMASALDPAKTLINDTIVKGDAVY